MKDDLLHYSGNCERKMNEKPVYKKRYINENGNNEMENKQYELNAKNVIVHSIEMKNYVNENEMKNDVN